VRAATAAEDHLRLTFPRRREAAGPGQQDHLVQKYVGAAARRRSTRLGAKGFQRRKEQVQEALFDLAATCSRCRRARRRDGRRTADGSDAIPRRVPVRDTPDQAPRGGDRATSRRRRRWTACCAATSASARPSWRARRVRVALHGRQVAVLAPTTRAGATARRARVASAASRSRCASTAVALPHAANAPMQDGLRRSARSTSSARTSCSGKDVALEDLGLVVDRRGAALRRAHKEQLKRCARRRRADAERDADPRTLHARLLGIRAISTLATPPPGRQEVETRAGVRNEPPCCRTRCSASSRAAARCSCCTTDRRARRARAPAPLAPGARDRDRPRPDGEAADREHVRAFVRGEVDVLVCTTIVENGLDLPDAQHDPDRPADQLRARRAAPAAAARRSQRAPGLLLLLHRSAASR
jgi:transcription-repair coupling factor (superfamily II helicase)